MQLLELIFFLVLATAIIRLVFGERHQFFTYANIAITGSVVLLAGLLFEGYRWQMLPAYLACALLASGLIRKSAAAFPLRVAAAVPLTLLLVLSIFLTVQLPIVRLPAPAGPFAVGTFDMSITDNARTERYAPERNRELYLQTWYPADGELVRGTEVSTLYQELYEGDANLLTYLVTYLRHIPTHSHINAPIAIPEIDAFPVLLFSHGGMSITSQNQQLMEHLASHGYVIVSIGHPYDSMKVNLENAGTIRMADDPPPDITLPISAMERGLLTRIRSEGELNSQQTSAVRGLLLSLADDYAEIGSEQARMQFLEAAMESELQAYRHLMTATSLGEYLTYSYVYQHSLVDYRLEDMQFVADSIATLDAPIPDFTDALDLSGFGIFGMSFGGATAGEFCKVDNRCIAGSNLDGTQFGRNWRKKVGAPFLMFYHEAHQGGNDFAYLPPVYDYWDYAVRDTEHFDFIEVAHTAPLLRLLGMTGSIDKNRMIEIVNQVQLNFFDHYIKGKPIPGELYTNIPEILVRKHER